MTSKRAALMAPAGEKEEEELWEVGFRFYPTEEELVSFYLHNKLHGSSSMAEIDRLIPTLHDIYAIDPSHLPRLAGDHQLCRPRNYKLQKNMQEEQQQWFFFTERQEREARGGRSSRSNSSGYWKTTGSSSYVYSQHNEIIGLKKAMVFYTGRAPTGTKTKWKLNEYKAREHELIQHHQHPTNNNSNIIPKLRHEVSLCRIYIMSGSRRAFDRRPAAIASTSHHGIEEEEEELD